MKRLILVTSPPASGETYVSKQLAQKPRHVVYLDKLALKNTKLTVIWVQTDVEVCRQRMISRNSDRDKWKLEHWAEYISGINFEIPHELNDPTCKDDLLIFENSSQLEFEESMERIINVIEE